MTFSVWSNKTKQQGDFKLIRNNHAFTTRVGASAPFSTFSKLFRIKDHTGCKSVKAQTIKKSCIIQA